MQTPEEFILQHANTIYDPVRAHDYYIRNRHLKGRRAGQKQQANKGNRSAAPKADRTESSPGVPKADVLTPEQQRKEVEARVKDLKAKLSRLHVILRKLLNQSQGRRVVDAKGRPVGGTTPSTKHTPAGSKKSSDLTAAQKQEAAKRSEKYRKEHPELSLSDQEKQLQRQVKEAQQKIIQVRETLIAAVLRAREKAKANRQK